MWSCIHERLLFGAAFNSFKGLTDDMLSCLSQHLDRYILRDQILLDQRTEKLILCLRSSRKSNLDLFKTDFYKKLEKISTFCSRLIGITSA